MQGKETRGTKELDKPDKNILRVCLEQNIVCAVRFAESADTFRNIEEICNSTYFDEDNHKSDI